MMGLPASAFAPVCKQRAGRKKLPTMTTLNDIVLIYFEDQPMAFARIEDIAPDHKKNWYHVKLLMLQIPLQTVTWILRDVYIQGAEFTMNGKRLRLEKVVCPEEQEAPPPDDTPVPPIVPESGGANVIPLARRKKKS